MSGVAPHDSQLTALLFGIGIGVFLVLYMQADFKQTYKKKLAADLKKAIVHSQPTWEQILMIAQSQRLSVSMAHGAVVDLLREVLTGENSDLQPHRDLLEGYIATYKATDPYDGLPGDTRVQLSRLKDVLGKQSHLIEPLTAQLKELVAVYERKQKFQRWYTTGGFFLGLAGLAFGWYAYIHPNAEVQPHARPTASVSLPAAAGTPIVHQAQ
jgi:hypothetical protein